MLLRPRALSSFRDSRKGLGGRADDEVLDSVSSCVVGNDGSRDLKLTLRLGMCLSICT